MIEILHESPKHSGPILLTGLPPSYHPPQKLSWTRADWPAGRWLARPPGLPYTTRSIGRFVVSAGPAAYGDEEQDSMSQTRQPSRDPSIKKVLLVDDHPIVREGVKMLIDAEEDLKVCGEAESAAEALTAMADYQPDVAIIDLSLKQSSGLELIKDARIRHPEIQILVLSMRDEGFYAERVLRAGAKGYIAKEEGPARVLDGLRKVLAGEIYVSERIATSVMSRIVDGGAAPGKSLVHHLTDRELAVFQLIGSGLATREIAAKLHISPKTVDSHREHIKEKLKLNSANDLLKHAIEWVRLQEPS